MGWFEKCHPFFGLFTIASGADGAWQAAPGDLGRVGMADRKKLGQRPPLAPCQVASDETD